MQRARILSVMALGMALSCAHDQSLQGRLTGAENNAREANADIQEADRRLQNSDLDKAGALLSDARALADDPQMVYYPDHENLLDRLRTAETRLDAAVSAKKKRDTAEKGVICREKAEQALNGLRLAEEPLRNRQELTRKLILAFREAADDVTRILDEGKILESDAVYEQFAQKARSEVTQAIARASLYKNLALFIEGPVAASDQAKALLEKAGAEKDINAHKIFLEAARDKFLACVSDGNGLVAKSVGLGNEMLSIQGQKITPKEFLANCEGQVKAVNNLLNPPTKPAKAVKASKKKKKKSQ